MKLVFLDFETYYDDRLNLKKITPVEYILDPQFQVNGCAIKEGLDGEPFWLDGPQLPSYFARLREEAQGGGLISHNALFDSCLTSWIYGFVPRLTVCTMSVARALLRYKLKGVSLDLVARELGLGVKGQAILKVKGMTLDMIKAAGLYEEYTAYAIDDVTKCAGIFEKLIQGKNYDGPTLPASELAVMDMVMRCALQPKFYLEPNLLAMHLQEVLNKKAELLQQVTATEAELKSNEKFAEFLRGLGIDPPMKISLTTGKETYAFSKTDIEFLDLLEHDDPAVQALMAARFGYKSTLEETRAQRFISISNLKWPNGAQGMMPMPLRYGGAHTHRLSGDWNLNVQNLTRGGKLRKALKVPQGMRALTADAAQIEARLTSWFCGCDKLTKQFASGEDVYSNFGTAVFGYKVTKETHFDERFCSKQAVLGLGFGLGDKGFQRRLATDSQKQIGRRIWLESEEAKRIVTFYRTEFREIPEMHKVLNYRVIPRLASGEFMEFGPLIIDKGAIILPDVTGEIGKGLRLFYHELQHKDGEWWFTYGGKRKKVYGGKLLENIIQALDRVIVMGAAMRIQMRIQPYKLAQQAHDENAYVVDEKDVEWVKPIIMEEMTRVPVWAPGLPLAAEIGVGLSYGDAK